MSEPRWLLSTVGQRLHHPEPVTLNGLGEPVKWRMSLCKVYLYERRTDYHDAQFGVEVHRRCKRCLQLAGLT